jgi:Heparinase II/III-like protein
MLNQKTNKTVFAAFLILVAVVLVPVRALAAKDCDDGFIALLNRYTSADAGFASSKPKIAETLTKIATGTFPGQENWSLPTSLRQSHPRLIILDQEIITIRSTIEKDPIASKLFQVFKTRAEEMLRSRGPQYSTTGEGALTEARLALKRFTTFAAMYRLTGDDRYCKQARAEMLQVCTFPDWGPSNFLDVAEVTASMAIGYDWLFEQINETDRKIIRDAIVKLGLDPGIAQYKGEGWWRLANSNWNFVCNSGLTMGALAIAEDEPVRAEKIIACAVISTPLAMNTFEPDGGWPEGPMYWTYGTRYAVYLLSSLQSALGTDFGLSSSAGLSETGFFRIHSESPTGECFNYADSETEVGRGAQMFWLSRRFRQPVFAGAELHIADIFPEMFHLLFYTPDHVTPAVAKLPLNKMFEGVNVACMRSSWADPKAAYIGFKGGDNKAHHAHLDLGTFVFDAAGFRWACDLGPDSYDLPGYFGEKRWNYYRTRTEGHNTLTISNGNQNRDATAKIIEFSATDSEPYAIADLSAAYDSFLSAKRGMKLLGKEGCLVEDEIEAPKAVPIEWHFHTTSTVQLIDGGKKALLTRHGKDGPVSMLVQILAPPGAVFSPQPVKFPAGQMQQNGITDLLLPLNISPGKTRIVVMISKESQGQSAKQIEVKPLSDWK